MSANEIYASSQDELESTKSRIREQFNVDFPDVGPEPVFYGRLSKTRIPEKIAIVDHRNGECFAVASEGYKILHHEQVVELAMGVTETLEEFGMPKIDIQFLNHGAKARIAINFPEVKMDISKLGDPVSPVINMYNSYDLGWKFGYDFGALQLVCTNGMKAFVISDAYRKRHLNTLSVDVIAEKVKEGLNAFSQQTNLWSRWAETQAKVLPSIEIPEWDMFSESEIERLINMPITQTNQSVVQMLEANNLTVWNLHSAATQFASHEIDSDIRRLDLQDKIEKMFMKSFN